ncbi:hypothetical protein [Actinotalea solisilvae]|uniref:hypothetical protein n=1 Tax=Actinotalea solisilvae TaxID=2072922 RepID=UPI0018F27468|nr:hypothetical protein [Actinotalea solisilvae]
MYYSSGGDASTPTPRLFGADPAQPVAEVPLETPPPAVWSCFYDPTMDYDWHNDVLCSDGVNVDRPYLLAEDSFVTEAEMADAAAAYEDLLNGG